MATERERAIENVKKATGLVLRTYERDEPKHVTVRQGEHHVISHYLYEVNDPDPDPMADEIDGRMKRLWGALVDREEKLLKIGRLADNCACYTCADIKAILEAPSGD